MEHVQPDWYERYMTPYTQEHQDWCEANKDFITNMEKTMNWTDEYDNEYKMEPNTRKVIYSGKNITKTTFNDKF